MTTTMNELAIENSLNSIREVDEILSSMWAEQHLSTTSTTDYYLLGAKRRSLLGVKKELLVKLHDEIESVYC